MMDNREQEPRRFKKVDILSPEVADRFQEMSEWVLNHTEVLKDLDGPSGEKVFEKFLVFILTNPGFDSILFMGSTGSGKTTVMMEVISFLKFYGYDVRKVMYGIIKTMLVDFFGTESWSWGQLEYGFSGYLTALWMLSQKPFETLFEKDFTREKLAERYKTYTEVLIHDTDLNFIQFMSAVYLGLSIDVASLDGRQQNISSPTESITAVEIPGGWEFDRGFTAAIAASAREMNLRNSVYKGQENVSASTFVFMIAPDFRTLDFAYRVRSEVLLTSEGNFKTLKQRLESLGFDPGEEFEKTEESGKKLAQIMDYMGKPVIIQNVREELMRSAEKWLRSGSMEEQARKKAIIDEVKLPKDVDKFITSYSTKVIIAFLEDLLLNKLRLQDFQVAVALNTFKGNGKPGKKKFMMKMHLSDLPQIHRTATQELPAISERPNKFERILFICKNNVGRSQWAEAIYNQLAGGAYASSAGIDTAEKMKKLGGIPSATSKQLLNEKGIDFKPGAMIKPLIPSRLNGVSKVVVFCEAELLPQSIKEICARNGIKIEYHYLPDPNPEFMTIEDRRKVINQLYHYLHHLIAQQEVV